MLGMLLCARLQTTTSLFSAISVSGVPTPTITTRAARTATSTTLQLPPFIPYRFRVIARNADRSWLAVSNYSAGLTLAPKTRVPFPINASYAATLGLIYRYDFTAEGSASGLAQAPDLSGNGYWLKQFSASQRPSVQPFVHGDMSALRMQGTSANPLGFMQVRRCQMKCFDLHSVLRFSGVPFLGTFCRHALASDEQLLELAKSRMGSRACPPLAFSVSEPSRIIPHVLSADHHRCGLHSWAAKPGDRYWHWKHYKQGANKRRCRWCKCFMLFCCTLSHF